MKLPNRHFSSSGDGVFWPRGLTIISLTAKIGQSLRLQYLEWPLSSSTSVYKFQTPVPAAEVSPTHQSSSVSFASVERVLIFFSPDTLNFAG